MKGTRCDDVVPHDDLEGIPYWGRKQAEYLPINMRRMPVLRIELDVGGHVGLGRSPGRRKAGLWSWGPGDMGLAWLLATSSSPANALVTAPATWS